MLLQRALLLDRWLANIVQITINGISLRIESSHEVQMPILVYDQFHRCLEVDHILQLQQDLANKAIDS